MAKNSAAGKYQKSYKPAKIMTKIIATKTVHTSLNNPSSGTQVNTDLHTISDAGTGTGWLLNLENLVGTIASPVGSATAHLTITQVLYILRNGTAYPTLSNDGVLIASGNNAQNTLWFATKVIPMNTNTAFANWNNDPIQIGTSRKLQPGDKLCMLTYYKTNESQASYQPVASQNISLQFFQST